ncbi:MAG: hypothetical protein ACR2NL_07515 [Acidimicrobiia bacterium]
MNNEPSPSIDRLIMAGAARTGFVTSAWLRERGAASGSISRREKRGELVRFCKGIYLVPELRRPDTVLRASLAALPESAGGYETAGEAYRFPVRPRGVIVVQKSPTRIQLPGVRIVRSRRFEIDSIVRRSDGLRLTSPQRTLFDVAKSRRGQDLIHLLEAQFVAKRPTAESFEHFVTGQRGRGVQVAGELTAVLATILDEQPYPDSVLEKIMFEGLAQRGAHMTRQWKPPWYGGIRGIVDSCEPIGATIAEADGRRFRQISRAHDNDRRRDLVAMANSYVVVRASHFMMTKEPSETFDRMAEIILTRKEDAERRQAS